MVETCEFHEEMVKRREDLERKQGDHDVALEGKISKSSIKWMAGIFSLPTIAAILTVWAFMASAEYRYGSSKQAQENAANVRLLDERTLTMKADMIRTNGDLAIALREMKMEMGEMRKVVMEIKK